MATLLVIDDDPAALGLCADMLRQVPDFTVATAATGAEGFEAARRLQPDIIISDLRMEGMTGLALCRQVKSDPQLRDALFVILTGATDIETMEEGIEQGADDYVVKPLRPREFLSRVRALVRIQMMRAELRKESAELERLHATLTRSFEGVIHLLTHIIGMRVPNATARAQRGARIAVWVASRLRLPAEDIRHIETAALLHEVGKVSLSDEVLRTPPEMWTAEQKEKARQFPLFGQLLVASLPQLESLGVVLRHQMENYDGTGYPDRLRQEHIPVGARILRGVNLLEDWVADGSVDRNSIPQLLEKSRGAARGRV